MEPDFETDAEGHWAALVENLASPTIEGLNGHESTGEDNELEVQRAQLLTQIRAAEDRTAGAHARLEEVSVVLRDEIATARERLASIDRDHEIQLEAVRAEAQADGDRILAEARERVEQLMEQARRLREDAVTDDGQ
jgi:hypothetical protein